MIVDNFGETLRMFKLLQDVFSQGVRWHGGDSADDGGWEVGGDERCTWFGGPGGNMV